MLIILLDGTPPSLHSFLTIESASKSAPQSTKALSSSPGRKMSFSRSSSVTWISRLWKSPMPKKFWMLSRTMSRTERSGCNGSPYLSLACTSRRSSACLTSPHHCVAYASCGPTASVPRVARKPARSCQMLEGRLQITAQSHLSHASCYPFGRDAGQCLRTRTLQYELK